MSKPHSDGQGEGGRFSWFKKWFMRQFWRAQQSQTIISLMFWAVTLSLLIFARIEHRWDANQTTFGIATSYAVMCSLFLSVGLFVLFVGWMYDRVFTLWKEHQNVIIERNPFATYLLTPRDAMILGHLSSLLRQQNPEDPAIQAQCDWMEKWVSTTPDLEVFRRMVAELDAKLGEPVPEFSFLPPGVVAAARAKARVEEDRDPT
jgi:hypothetical protein